MRINKLSSKTTTFSTWNVGKEHQLCWGQRWRDLLQIPCDSGIKAEVGREAVYLAHDWWIRA